MQRGCAAARPADVHRRHRLPQHRPRTCRAAALGLATTMGPSSRSSASRKESPPRGAPSRASSSPTSSVIERALREGRPGRLAQGRVRGRFQAAKPQVEQILARHVRFEDGAGAGARQPTREHRAAAATARRRVSVMAAGRSCRREAPVRIVLHAPRAAVPDPARDEYRIDTFAPLQVGRSTRRAARRSSPTPVRW